MILLPRCVGARMHTPTPSTCVKGQTTKLRPLSVCAAPLLTCVLMLLACVHVHAHMHGVQVKMGTPPAQTAGC